MKKLIYIMLSLCCLVFYSCGMTEPWKDWEHEGDMSADRLRPSEVKELLCAADGWKMIYQGITFYFQFDEEGNVTEKVNLNPEKGMYGIEIPPCTWHCIVVLEPGTVIYEIKLGPYAPLTPENMAPWAPDVTDEEGIKAFMKRMSEV